MSAGPLPDLTKALADRSMGDAPRGELSPLLEVLAAETLPASPKLSAPAVRATRLVRRLLDWLEEQPGDTWQKRWDSWIGKGEQDWRPNPGSSGQGVKWETSYAVDALIIAGVVRPTYEWMVSQTRKRLWKDWTRHHDTETFTQVVDAVERRGGFRATTRVVTLLAMMSIRLGKPVPELTAHDFRDLREVYHVRGIRHHGLPNAWVACKDVGLMPNEPASYAELTHVEKMTPKQLVDRHGVDDPQVRKVFIEYLTEVSVSCDYKTLYQLELILVKNFWGDIQAHHPGISTLRLDAAQATGWRTRIKTLDNGKPRQDWAQIMDRVRTFYNDIAAWAMDDPGTWAKWVAANPIPRSAMKGTRSKNTRRQQNNFKQRTRTLAPWIPQLVASVTAEKVRMTSLLAAAEAVEPGSTFIFEDQKWIRRGHLHSSRGKPSYTLTTTLVVDPAGGTLNVSHLEHKAYWMKSATYPLLLVSACSCASLLAALAKQHSDVAHTNALVPVAERSYLTRIRPLIESRGRLEPRGDWLGLQGENRGHRLMNLPEWLMVDERAQRIYAETVLALGELALLAEEPVAQYVEGVGVVRAVDDPQVFTAAHLDPRLDAPFRQMCRLDDHPLTSRRREVEPLLSCGFARPWDARSTNRCRVGVIRSPSILASSERCYSWDWVSASARPS